MAKEGSVAPKERVNIVYKSGTGDAQEEVELPLKLMMIGDYTQREEEAELEDRDVVNVNKSNFNDVMAGHNLSLNMVVPNRLVDAEDEELPVEMHFNGINDFSPESVVKQIPELNKLLELRESLTFLKGPLGNIPAFRKHIDALLSDEESRKKLMSELGVE
ncbi:MAG: type VI secretion system contractile sheath small subunit [Oceanospirillaceae bacterium]|nr:type VI secretion system contractile sheath small subunit [Oceanospirillaceae bacterium]